MPCIKLIKTITEVQRMDELLSNVLVGVPVNFCFKSLQHKIIAKMQGINY